MTHKIRIVDVFTDKALAGNQLAVVLDAKDIPLKLMQRIAREMNFSETTFILPPEDPEHAARVRIFTPHVEMRFAGHPTIGTAWVLADEGLVPDDTKEFTLEENVGPVPVRRDGAMCWLTNPPLSFGEVFPHAQVATALGIEQADIINNIPAQVVTTGNPMLYVALRDMVAVDKATSDRERIERLLRGGRAFGVYLFASMGENRLYSRMFSTDITEDPASGSAGGPVGAFAVKYGLVPRDPHVAVISEQGTKMGRQSILHIHLTYGDSKDVPEQSEVGGSVIPVLSGTLADFA